MSNTNIPRRNLPFNVYSIKSECIVCKRTFTKRRQNHSLCSALCKASLNTARERVARLRLRNVEDDGELPKKNCVICGKAFEQRQSTYILCGAKKCKQRRQAQMEKEWHSANAYLFKRVGE